MSNEFTRYFAELRLKDAKDEEPSWHPYNKLGEESLEEARDGLEFLKRHFSKNWKFRIVKRDYTYKETVLEEQTYE